MQLEGLELYTIVELNEQVVLCTAPIALVSCSWYEVPTPCSRFRGVERLIASGSMRLTGTGLRFDERSKKGK
jgi:hypothetical protein